MKILVRREVVQRGTPDGLWLVVLGDPGRDPARIGRGTTPEEATATAVGARPRPEAPAVPPAAGRPEVPAEGEGKAAALGELGGFSLEGRGGDPQLRRRRACRKEAASVRGERGLHRVCRGAEQRCGERQGSDREGKPVPRQGAAEDAC